MYAKIILTAALMLVSSGAAYTGQLGQKTAQAGKPALTALR